MLSIWGSQDPKRNRSPSALGRVRSIQILSSASIFWALCFCGFLRSRLALSYRASPAPIPHSAKAMGRSSSAKPSGHIYNLNASSIGQIGDPVICYLRPHREFGTSVFPRGSTLSVASPTTKTRHFVGKGWRDSI